MIYPACRALDGIDLSIPAGMTVAVVGHTGAGKSTPVALVPRLMDPPAGRVLLDGIDLRDLSPAELRHHIGFVPQETFLFSDTLAGNIAFGDHNATPDQIRRAAELGVKPRIAIAQNPDAAIFAARTFSGVSIVPYGDEAKYLGDLPVSALAPSPELAETLARWGIRRLRELAALPALGVA